MKNPMTLQARIWSLPLAAILIFLAGSGVNWWFSRMASTSLQGATRIQYPYLQATERLSSEFAAIQDGLKSAVSASDKAGLERTSQKIVEVRKVLDGLAAVDGKRPQADRFRKEFDDYFASAQSAAAIMLGAKAGDATAALQAMQVAHVRLEKTLEQAQSDAQGAFESTVGNAESHVKQGLVANLFLAVVVVSVLAIISRFVVAGVVRQIGGEPEYAADIVRGVAAGDLSVPIRRKRPANPS